MFLKKRYNYWFNKIILVIISNHLIPFLIWGLTEIYCAFVMLFSGLKAGLKKKMKSYSKQTKTKRNFLQVIFSSFCAIYIRKKIDNLICSSFTIFYSSRMCCHNFTEFWQKPSILLTTKPRKFTPRFENLLGTWFLHFFFCPGIKLELGF